MTEPWELTEDEILSAKRMAWPQITYHEDRAIAAAAVKKYQEWLANKGDGPRVEREQGQESLGSSPTVSLSWRLTPTEKEAHRKDLGVMCQHCDVIVGMVDQWDIDSLLAAAQKKLLDYLSSQVGPNPCEDCVFGCEECQGQQMANHYHKACGPYAKYLGQQQGYAKGQRDLAQEASEYMHSYKGTLCDYYARTLDSWFKEKGLQERGK